LTVHGEGDELAVAAEGAGVRVVSMFAVRRWRA
jgi:hypothetical protein